MCLVETPRFENGVRILFDEVVAAYNAHDFDRIRLLFAHDFACVDHRPASFGSFGTEDFISLTAGLFAQVRSQCLTLTSFESVGLAAIVQTLETAETHYGGEVVFETFCVGLVTDGRVRRFEFFAPEAEAEARAVFRDFARTN
jgi:hypothetical protein